MSDECQDHRALVRRAEKAEENALAWSETYRGGIKVRDEWRTRAETAEAAVARVEALKADLFLHGGFTIARWEAARLVSAALDGK